MSLLYPVPINPSRGVFVDDHVALLREMGHEVRVVNTLPRMPKYAEARRSTMYGVARTPKRWMHEGHEILVPRFVALPDHPYPRITAWSMARRRSWIESQLGDWRPDLIVCHTLWPAAVLAKTLARRWNVPWVGVVHGHDFDVGLAAPNLRRSICELATSCDALVCVTPRLTNIGRELNPAPSRLLTVPCRTVVDKEWRRPVRPLSKPWKKEPIDILFPADPRRPEKQHLLALQTGEVLEGRGWMVGITSLRHQPRHIVLDRMLVADVTLITSRREAGPLVARESLLCGTPVVSVDVGEVATYLPEAWVREADPEALADGIEAALKTGWTSQRTVEESLAFASTQQVRTAWDELLASLVE